MEIKLLEIRDTATYLQAIAIKISGRDGFLARDAGYGDDLILFGRANGGEFSYDPFFWGDRTMATAHRHLCDNFDSIEDNGLVDVRHVLGETSEPCQSERKREDFVFSFDR